MQIRSFPGRFDPLCPATLVLMNRETIPSPTGLNCKPCVAPVVCGPLVSLPSTSDTVKVYFPVTTSVFGPMTCIGGNTFTLSYIGTASTFSPFNTCHALGSSYTGSFDYWQYGATCVNGVVGGTYNWAVTFVAKRSGVTTFEAGLGISYSGSAVDDMWSEQPCYTTFTNTFPPFYRRTGCVLLPDFGIVSW